MRRKTLLNHIPKMLKKKVPNLPTVDQEYLLKRGPLRQSFSMPRKVLKTLHSRVKITKN